MMPIHVYHNPDFLTFYHEPDPQAIDLTRLYLAAIVATDEPKTAYRLTQHVETWYENPGVTTVVRSRSTSVGDVLETDDGRLLLVAPFGFTEIADTSLPAENTAVIQVLRALAAENETCEEALRTIVLQVRHLYTALLFATSVLEAVSDDEVWPVPDQALLARFAAEQAHWALRYCSGQALSQAKGG